MTFQCVYHIETGPKATVIDGCYRYSGGKQHFIYGQVHIYTFFSLNKSRKTR